MLSIEFLTGSFCTVFLLGFTIGKQFLIFKRAVEISTSG